MRCMECPHHFRWEIVVEKDEDWGSEETGDQIAALRCPQCDGKTDMQSVFIQRI